MPLSVATFPPTRSAHRRKTNDGFGGKSTHSRARSSMAQTRRKRPFAFWIPRMRQSRINYGWRTARLANCTVGELQHKLTMLELIARRLVGS